jgi:hypothetical protein
MSAAAATVTTGEPNSVDPEHRGIFMRQQRQELLADRTAAQPGRRVTGLGTRRTGRPHGAQILTTKVGLRFPAEVTFDSWQRAGVQISRIVDSFAWCLGDWLVYGQQRYTDRYRKAVDAIGLDYQTLRNYASVARRVDLPRRRSTLSFQHHAEVAALPDLEQETWLSRAEEGGWSRNQLRQHLQAARGDQTQGTMTATLPKMVVQQDRMAKWRLAAASSSSEFEQWVIAALDQAAARELDA